MSTPNHGDWDLFGDIARINHWIESANGPSQHEDSMRVLKIGEEIGEAFETLAPVNVAYGRAVAAYIGMTGQNPRKGVTHTSLDLLRELADVAVTALCAMEHFTGSPEITRGLLASKITEIIVRAGIPLVPERK
jgi:hypothetical protein